jgi:hypothetical protein
MGLAPLSSRIAAASLVATGGSLTAMMVIVKVCVAEVSTPPLAQRLPRFVSRAGRDGRRPPIHCLHPRIFRRGLI